LGVSEIYINARFIPVDWGHLLAAMAIVGLLPPSLGWGDSWLELKGIRCVVGDGDEKCGYLGTPDFADLTLDTLDTLDGG
jgi:hypothetical protein